MKTAILYGATGFVGSYLLEFLLGSPDYERVIAVVRRPLDITHAKLKVVIADPNTLEKVKSELVADEIFIALGTTKKNTPDPQAYYQVDHDYPLLAAKIAKENGAKSVFIVTGVGATADSRFFYIRTKGETERDLVALGFLHTHIFQPSMITGTRREFRALEKTLISAWGFIDPLLVGGLKRYRGMDGKDIAKAMVNAASVQTDRVKRYEWPELDKLRS